MQNAPGQSCWATPPPGGFNAGEWFLADLNIVERLAAFIHISEDVLQRSVFLDSRIAAPLEQASWVNFDSIPKVHGESTVGLLLHTSFCCSTLLSRALHVPKYSVSLREPLAIRKLVDAYLLKQDVNEAADISAALLARPWMAAKQVLIKPSHVTLPVMCRFIESIAQTKTLVLTSTLERFLVSNIKKPSSTQAKVPELVYRFIRGTALERPFTDALKQQPRFLQFVAAQWFAMQFHVGTICAIFGNDRVRILQEETLLGSFDEYVGKSADWLGFSFSTDQLLEHARMTKQNHAKNQSEPYKSDDHAVLHNHITSRFGREIEDALRWAEENLKPIMREQIDLSEVSAFQLR